MLLEKALEYSFMFYSFPLLDRGKHESPNGNQVISWVNDSSYRFNQALIEVATAESVDTGMRHDTGYEKIHRRWVFTGASYCDDATTSYGVALKRKFRSIGGREYILMQIPYWHRILKFSIGRENYFLDATYGQVNGSINTIVIDKLSQISNYYSPIHLDAEAITDVREGAFEGDGERINRITDYKYCFTPFTGNECRAAEFVIGGQLIRPRDYLVKALLNG